MKREFIKLLKDLCLLGTGCAFLGFGSCKGEPIFVARAGDQKLPVVKKCTHQGIPTEKITINNQYERKE